MKEESGFYKSDSFVFYPLPLRFLFQRSFLVNAAYVGEVRKYFGNRYIICLNDSSRTKLTSGRNYADDIKKMIEFE